MSYNYRRLWKLLIDLDMNKSDLRAKAGLSSSTIAKLGQNKVVQIDVLDRICQALNCNIEDVMEIEHDKKGVADTTKSRTVCTEKNYSINSKI